MEQQKPQIPTLKDSQKPQVKIKGLQAGLSLIDRLKQFKKKDLAFISAGLGVLFMAPLAEHFMMAPENQGTAFNPGWDFKNAGALGANASPYENGINGLAPGGVTGGGDIITPLNVRDPSSLVMGPGASQQAPATNVAPPPPPKAESNEWKDALAASKAGASEAVKRAALPVPKPSLTNAGLRGLGAVSGGGGGSYSMAPINSAGLTTNRAAGSNSLQRVQAAPGFRGASARGSKSGGSLENLKKVAGGQMDQMNRSGPGGGALESAANMAMQGGAGAGGRGAGGEGKEDKGPGGNQDKNASNIGESLEFMRMKQEQEKAIDLKWKLKEADAMLWPDLKKEMLKELAMAPVKGISSSIQDMMKNFGSEVGGKTDYIQCHKPEYWKDKASNGWCVKGGMLGQTREANCDITQGGGKSSCEKVSMAAPGTDATNENVRDGSRAVPPVRWAKPDGVNLTLPEACDSLRRTAANEKDGTAIDTLASSLESAARNTMAAQRAMSKDGELPTCGPGAVGTVKLVIDGYIDVKLGEIEQLLRGPEDGALRSLSSAAKNLNEAAQALKGKFVADRTGMNEAQGKELSDAQGKADANTLAYVDQIEKILGTIKTVKDYEAAKAKLDGILNAMVDGVKTAGKEKQGAAQKDLEAAVAKLKKARTELDTASDWIEKTRALLKQAESDLAKAQPHKGLTGTASRETKATPQQFYDLVELNHRQEVGRLEKLEGTFKEYDKTTYNGEKHRVDAVNDFLAVIPQAADGKSTRQPVNPNVTVPAASVSNYVKDAQAIVAKAPADDTEAAKWGGEAQKKIGSSPDAAATGQVLKALRDVGASTLEEGRRASALIDRDLKHPSFGKESDPEGRYPKSGANNLRVNNVHAGHTAPPVVTPTGNNP